MVSDVLVPPSRIGNVGDKGPSISVRKVKMLQINQEMLRRCIPKL